MTQTDADLQIVAIQSQIATHQLNIAAWQALLLADATGPEGALENYSLDGESLDREAWRNGLANRIKTALECVKMLLDQITQIQQVVNNLNPFWLPTRQIL